MDQNPLQKFFRQPKIFISLPSKGVYSKPGTIQGDIKQIPVYSMTGMDEIIMKTPDALLSGESTVRVIESCCPSIKNAWELSVIDTSLIFSAIRIATYGNLMTVNSKCRHCNSDNEYEINLNTMIEHFTKCEFSSKIVVGDLAVKLQPLTYRQSTDFNLKNFQLQQKLAQAEVIEDKEQQQKIVNEIFVELSVIQKDLYACCVESVETPEQRVTERPYIVEWLNNCEKTVFDAIKKQIDFNQEVWKVPATNVVCDHCEGENSIYVELDQSNFFE